jgi:AraC-like DNA-binding protein
MAVNGRESRCGVVSRRARPFNQNTRPLPMRGPVQFLRETHLVGRRCRELMLGSDHFPVLRKAPFIWVGYSMLRPPYRMVRLRSVHSHIVAAVSGRGRTLIDGAARNWAPGQVLLAPVGQHHAFEMAGAGPWTIAWVFFDDTENAPALRGARPELIAADPSDFVATLQTLTREAAGPSQPSMMEALVSVLETTARRLAGSAPIDQRLWRLWAAVEADLARKWTVPALARVAGMSEEHLRRLSHRNYQHSPMDHLAHLRMRRASTMLRSSLAKIEDIALQVGYGSAYSFSVAFSRWSGAAPGRFRRESIPLARARP